MSKKNQKSDGDSSSPGYTPPKITRIDLRGIVAPHLDEDKNIFAATSTPNVTGRTVGHTPPPPAAP